MKFETEGKEFSKNFRFSDLIHLIQIGKNNCNLETAGKVRKKIFFSGTNGIKIYMQQ
jgi:hypothetical protein